MSNKEVKKSSSQAFEDQILPTSNKKQKIDNKEINTEDEEVRFNINKNIIVEDLVIDNVSAGDNTNSNRASPKGHNKHFKKELIEKHANDQETEVLVDDCHDSEEILVASTSRRKRNSNVLYRHPHIEYIKLGTKAIDSKSMQHSEKDLNKCDKDEQLKINYKVAEKDNGDNGNRLDYVDDKIESVKIELGTSRIINRETNRNLSPTGIILETTSNITNFTERHAQNSIIMKETRNGNTSLDVAKCESVNFLKQNINERICNTTNDENFIIGDKQNNIRTIKTRDILDERDIMKCKLYNLTKGNESVHSDFFKENSRGLTTNTILKTPLDFPHIILNKAKETKGNPAHYETNNNNIDSTDKNVKELREKRDLVIDYKEIRRENKEANFNKENPLQPAANCYKDVKRAILLKGKPTKNEIANTRIKMHSKYLDKHSMSRSPIIPKESNVIENDYSQIRPLLTSNLLESADTLPLGIPESICIFNMQFKYSYVISTYEQFYRTATFAIQDILNRTSKCLTFPLTSLWHLQSNCDTVVSMLTYPVDGSIPLLAWDICKRTIEIVEFFKENYFFIQTSNLNNEHFNNFTLPIRIAMIENMIVSYTKLYKNLKSTSGHTLFDKFEYYFNLRLQQSRKSPEDFNVQNETLVLISQRPYSIDEHNVDHFKRSHHFINSVINNRFTPSNVTQSTSGVVPVYSPITERLYNCLPNNLHDLIITSLSYKYFKNYVKYISGLSTYSNALCRSNSTNLVSPTKSSSCFPVMDSLNSKQEDVNNMYDTITPLNNVAEPNKSPLHRVNRKLNNISKLIKVRSLLRRHSVTESCSANRTKDVRNNVALNPAFIPDGSITTFRTTRHGNLKDDVGKPDIRELSQANVPTFVNTCLKPQVLVTTEDVPLRLTNSRTVVNRQDIQSPIATAEVAGPIANKRDNAQATSIRKNLLEVVSKTEISPEKEISSTAMLKVPTNSKDSSRSEHLLSREKQKAYTPTITPPRINVGSPPNHIQFSAATSSRSVSKLDDNLQNLPNLPNKSYNEITPTELIECSRNHKQLDACHETIEGPIKKDNNLMRNTLINDGKTDGTMNAYDYVQHLKYLKNHVPSDFYDYYEFVSRSQIRNGNLPIRFEIFIELHNYGLLTEYYTKFVRYREMSQQTL